MIATPGGIVSDASNFNLLLANCFTVWLKASPEEHMIAGSSRRATSGRWRRSGWRRCQRTRDASGCAWEAMDEAHPRPGEPLLQQGGYCL